jgi:hypothetical protein
MNFTVTECNLTFIILDCTYQEMIKSNNGQDFLRS